jgi:signal transduction histidine kinase
MDLDFQKGHTVMVITVAAGVSAILLGIFYNQHYTSLSSEILNQSAANIRSNVEIEAHDISEIFGRSVTSITDNLRLIAGSLSIQNNNINNNDNDTASFNLLNLGQEVTANLTDFYMWLDGEGKIVWISNLNESAYQRYKGTDLSYRDYFYLPKQNGRIYYSSIIDSNDNIPRLYISYPIHNISNADINDASLSTNNNGQYEGVITAGIRIDSIGRLLQSALPPKYNSSVGLIEGNGTILYTSANQSLIGLNAFGNEFQAIVPSEIKEPFNSFLRESLKTSTPSVHDIEYQDDATSIAYQPISLDDHNIGTLYISASHTLAENVRNIINQQTLFSTIIYVLIASTVLGIALVILTSRRRLQAALNKRTFDLIDTIDKLKKSNEMLSSMEKSLQERQVQLTTINKELQQANEQLRKHDKLQQDFINVAAHELRTPTQSIIGYTELLQQDIEFENGKASADIYESLAAINRNAIRLKNLTNDMLDVARIESGILKLNKEKINLNEKVRNVIKEITTINQQVKEKNLTLQFVNDEINNRGSSSGNGSTHYYANADKARIFQVLSNLVNNAVKFSDRNGTISISIEKVDSNTYFQYGVEKNVLLVRVKDSGRGIDPEIQPRLFTKFETRSDIGTGLGLFIAKSIIEAHGGKIWAENRVDSKGAIFTFSLPTN